MATYIILSRFDLGAFREPPAFEKLAEVGIQQQ
jgi:hypothetical protein